MLIIWQYKKGTISPRLHLLGRIFPWLVIGNLIFIFIIGMPGGIPYRFSGYNLGPDTVFPATWSMFLWLIAVILELWRENKFTWLSSLILFVLITNSLTFLSFPPHWYELRERQKKIFLDLYHFDCSLPMDVTIPIPVESIAFSKAELEHNTLPMLRGMGILSSERKILVVSQEVYENWRIAPEKNNILPLLRQHTFLHFVDFSKNGYPDFLTEVYGVSEREKWGRWTDGPEAKFRFKNPLPKRFTLELKVSAFGPNVGIPIKIRVGKIEKTFTVIDSNPKVFYLEFDRVKNVDTIEILPPKPISPFELYNNNGDKRELGVGLVYLKIIK